VGPGESPVVTPEEPSCCCVLTMCMARTDAHWGLSRCLLQFRCCLFGMRVPLRCLCSASLLPWGVVLLSTALLHNDAVLRGVDATKLMYG
jgi:hypothetical protein